MIKVLHCLDADELEGCFESWDEWGRFRDNPSQFLINCDDDQADKIWRAARKRFDPQKKAREDREADNLVAALS
tara:strand:+ start:982 stop:1203 length:222 start_codon:yes stop_codon:yes gene_type:complete